ncbi:MAG: hypothetical protein RL238_1830 [Actinomycetota bacterium]|jgi:hypothetical protein
MGKPGPKNPLSDAHKAALAKGRMEGRVVREYLEALKANKPVRGRKRTPETIRRQLSAAERALATASPIAELQLVQQRIDLQRELEVLENKVDLAARERAFVQVAKSYGDRTGVKYEAWRAVGVPAAVLKSAGIGRRG